MKNAENKSYQIFKAAHPNIYSMKIKVRFWSYFSDLTGCKQTSIEVDKGITLGQLHEKVCDKFSELKAAKNSTLKVVNVDYQDSNFVLSDGDEVSLFPPVQGG